MFLGYFRLVLPLACLKLCTSSSSAVLWVRVHKAVQVQPLHAKLEVCLAIPCCCSHKVFNSAGKAGKRTRPVFDCSLASLQYSEVTAAVADAELKCSL